MTDKQPTAEELAAQCAISAYERLGPTRQPGDQDIIFSRLQPLIDRINSVESETRERIAHEIVDYANSTHLNTREHGGMIRAAKIARGEVEV